MLYISTRDRADSFTAHRVLNNSLTPDGGMFVPMQLPRFREEQLLAMKGQSFAEVVAGVLNLFFDKKLTGWDIDFQIGRNPFKLAEMSHRLMIAQLWHNHGADYLYFERAVYDKLGGIIAPGSPLPEWPRIAIRIAVLFGVYSELLRRGISSFDVAVPAVDFTVAMAVCYAGNMGLPVEMIVCGCDENSGIWDLIHRGEIPPVPAAQRKAQDPDRVERLIFDRFGREENLRYLDTCRRARAFKITQEQQDVLENRFFAAVASDKRVESIMGSLARNNNFMLDASAAMAYCALQDYRARTGESRTTLIMADRNPRHSADTL